MTTLKKVFIYTIILGTAAVAINLVFGNAVSFLSTATYNGIRIYKFDFYNYAKNIQNSLTGITDLKLDTPTREWQNFNGINWPALGNNLALMLDWFIFMNNILLYPLRFTFYIIRVLLSILGIPTQDGTYENNSFKWLIDMTNWFIQKAQIGYV